MTTALETAPIDPKRLEDLLGLPELRPFSLTNDAAENYGAGFVAAAYCGFKRPPTPIPGIWLHGWVPENAYVHPDLIFGVRFSEHAERPLWVAKKHEEEYLRLHGASQVEAIGLPLVYLPHRPIPRRPRSLLVMPVHSTDGTSTTADFEDYIDVIDGLRGQFSEIVICVHPSCWRRGYWVEPFQQRGYQVIRGASTGDANALERVRTLLSTFEFMTTNGFGSHLAYGAFYGAKVSIYGSYVEPQAEDYRRFASYTATPGLLELTVQAFSSTTIKQTYPHLFCLPQEAQRAEDWGRFELGATNKRSPRQLRALFGWSRTRQVAYFLREAAPEGLKHVAKLVQRPQYRAEQAELARLRRLPPHQPGVSHLPGHSWRFLDAASFLSSYRDWFQQELYRFYTPDQNPFIIDVGARTGLGPAYWKRIYPQSRVLAFEPDPAAFAALEANCQTSKLEGVRLLPQAIWTDEGTVALKRDAGYCSRVVEEELPGTVRVPACRLEPYLRETVHFLRLNVPGHEVKILQDCGDTLRNVRNLVVEYHSFFEGAQELDLLFGLLKRAGFRVHVHAPVVSRQPLAFRQVRQATDLQLRVFAYRE